MAVALLSVVFRPEGETIISDMAALMPAGKSNGGPCHGSQSFPLDTDCATSAHILAKASHETNGARSVHLPRDSTKEGPWKMSLIEKSCKYFEQLWSFFS